MTDKIRIKRSSVQDKVPLTTDVELGELAMNTYDGKVFMKKDDGSESIVEVGAGAAGDIDGGDAGPFPAPVFTGTIADITVTNGEAITPVDVSSNYSTGGPVDSYSLQNNPSWMSIDNSGLITGTADAEAVTAGVTVTGTNITDSAVSNAFTVTASFLATFTAIVVPSDFVTSNTINCTGNFEVDWGDGNFIQYASGNAIDVASGDINIQNQDGNTISGIKFSTDTFSDINITKSNTLTTFNSICRNLSLLITFNVLDTSAVTTFSSAFDGCTNVTSFPAMDMSNAGTLTQAFMNCSSATSIGSLNTSDSLGVWGYKIFDGCTNLVCLTNINTVGWNDKGSMFTGCTSLTAPDSGEQTTIASGSNWTNPGSCP